ncbi:MAG TPA: hypothetical protein PLQ13_00445 [Candidatus Krumholzibacteria bacterium]|nr:hypothetical protein [Candidatus Krumholzibacteria bacterium]
MAKDLLAFIHVAKTGGQSVETMLRSSFGPAHAEAVEWAPRPGDDPYAVDYIVPKYGPDDLRRLKRLVPFLRSVGGHGVALWSGFEQVQPVRWFAFLRDPIARGASHFQYHRTTERPDLAWRAWVDWPVHHNHQLKMFSPTADAQDAIRRIEAQDVFVGLTERFDESLLVFQRLLRPDLDIAYLRTNTAGARDTARGLLADPASRADLERMYGDERPLYEWVANELYPRYVRAYGPTLAADLEAFRARRHRINRVNTLLNRVCYRALIRPRLPRGAV